MACAPAERRADRRDGQAGARGPRARRVTADGKPGQLDERVMALLFAADRPRPGLLADRAAARARRGRHPRSLRPLFARVPGVVGLARLHPDGEPLCGEAGSDHLPLCAGERGARSGAQPRREIGALRDRAAAADDRARVFADDRHSRERGFRSTARRSIAEVAELCSQQIDLLLG